MTQSVNRVVGIANLRPIVLVGTNKKTENEHRGGAIDETFSPNGASLTWIYKFTAEKDLRRGLTETDMHSTEFLYDIQMSDILSNDALLITLDAPLKHSKKIGTRGSLLQLHEGFTFLNREPLAVLRLGLK